jgi:hypothetical protein
MTRLRACFDPILIGWARCGHADDIVLQFVSTRGVTGCHALMLTSPRPEEHAPAQKR